MYFQIIICPARNIETICFTIVKVTLGEIHVDTIKRSNTEKLFDLGVWKLFDTLYLCFHLPHNFIKIFWHKVNEAYHPEIKGLFLV